MEIILNDVWFGYLAKRKVNVNRCAFSLGLAAAWAESVEAGLVWSGLCWAGLRGGQKWLDADWDEKSEEVEVLE